MRASGMRQSVSISAVPNEQAHARGCLLRRLNDALRDDTSPPDQVAHQAARTLLARIETNDPGGRAEEWDRFLGAATGLLGRDNWSVTVGVMANLIVLADRPQPNDLTMADLLLRRYGHRRLAAIRNSVDELLGYGPQMPVATRAVRALADDDAIVESLVASGVGPRTAAEIAGRCGEMGFWLAVNGVEPRTRGKRLSTADGLKRMWEHGDLRSWRAQLSIIASNPWAPHGAYLKDLAILADLPFLADAIDAAIRLFTVNAERAEQEQVAREIRRLVALSGLSQRQFAAMIGTSAPRLSTYVNGITMPSAAMMVRMRRVARMIQSGSR